MKTGSGDICLCVPTSIARETFDLLADLYAFQEPSLIDVQVNASLGIFYSDVPNCIQNETSEQYTEVIASLDQSWRVITCKDARQWNLQRRDAQKSVRAQWRASGYFVAKSALILASRTFCGPVAPKAVATLSALPENFVLEALK